jgi:O-antigen biosynthesis protein
MIQRIKQSLKLIWLIISDARYRIIFRSGLFDKDYYLHVYPDVSDENLHPLIHYLKGGELEGRKPNPFFDPSFYFRQYPDLHKEGILPFLHYILQGWRENRQPSHLFCPEYYISQIEPLNDSIGNPLVHFLKKGITKGIRPSPYFDPDYYLRNNPDVPAGSLNAYVHYLEIGSLERRRPSFFFDSAWYQDKASILKGMKMDLIQHFVEYGCMEGKSPIPLFDPAYYRENNQDVKATEEDLFLHYLRTGIPEDRRPCNWFDPKFYREKNADAIAPGLSPLEHYLQHGVYEGRYTEEKVYLLPQKPLISIIVPVYNVEIHYLNNCIRSVLYQSYPHWELCLVDDFSTKTDIRPVLEKWATLDRRIKIDFLPSNKGIVAASNTTAAMATGEYLGFLDNDDELSPECLYEIVREICLNESELIYTDEDLTGDDGRRFSVFRKPDYNRELSLVHNFAVHFMVTVRHLFEGVGGFGEGMDGAQDYDLFLKISEKARRINHIPKVLYHWRASSTSTSINHGQKEYADEAGRRALEGHLQRQGIKGEVQDTDLKFFYRTKRLLPDKPTVSVVVYYCEESDPDLWIQNLLESTNYLITEIFIFTNDSKTGNTLQAGKSFNTAVSWQLIEKGQGLSAIFNNGAALCTGEYIVFLCSNLTVAQSDWIAVLLEHASTRDTGMAGPRIDYPGTEKRKVETLPDLTDPSPEYYARFLQECSSHMNGLQCPQNVLAVSWNLCMIKKELFHLNGGFSEENFPHLFGNIDFCLRLRERGFENVYTPYCVAKWQTSTNRFDSKIWGEKWAMERDRFKKTWFHTLKKGDPYYNLGLLEDNNINIKDFLAWYAGPGSE